MSKPVEITDDTFESEVLQAENLVLVDFWATWCAPCLMIAPTLEEVAEKHADQVTVAKLDVDSNPATPGKLGVMGIPTLILFKEGQELERITGFIPKDDLLAKLTPHFG